jgi:hypothetical protein
MGGIRSPLDAVRAAIVAESRASERQSSATNAAKERQDGAMRDILGMGQKK